MQDLSVHLACHMQKKNQKKKLITKSCFESGQCVSVDSFDCNCSKLLKNETVLNKDFFSSFLDTKSYIPRNIPIRTITHNCLKSGCKLSRFPGSP